MNETAFDFGGGFEQPETQRSDHSSDRLAKTIERVANIIDLETETLRRFQPIDLASFNHQKSHALLDLTRALRALPPGTVDLMILDDLARLRAKLEKNLAVLDVHLKAVRQVSALIARAIEDDNSDGTYTMSLNRAALYYD